jgi:hypothetical protein
MAARRERIKVEKSEDGMAVKAFRNRVRTAQRDKSYHGHWEFENGEEEAVARTFMRKTHERPITAAEVFLEQLAEEGVSVILDVQLKWVEDGGNQPGNNKRKKGNIRNASAEEEESTEEWEDESMITTKTFPKKSLVVKLPVDFSRLNAKKRKQSPSSDATSAPKTKKLKQTAHTTAGAQMQHLEEEIQTLTVEWMRQKYQHPAMSNSGFKNAHSIEDNGEQSDSSGLSDPPDSMDIDDWSSSVMHSRSVAKHLRGNIVGVNRV